MSTDLCNAARYAARCASNAAKGGRPRKANAAETQYTAQRARTVRAACAHVTTQSRVDQSRQDQSRQDIPPEPPEGAEVNKRLGATTTTPPAATQTPAATATSYRVRVTSKELRIRKGPGTNYPIAQNAIAPGVYTIVAESKGTGSTKGWGKLKSGAGWISLDFAAKI